MKNIIWTKEELQKIRKIILNTANLKYNEETSELTVRSDIAFSPIYNDFYEDIYNLLFIKDKRKVEEVLKQASQVKADENNRNHYGLITSLSNINPNDHTQIFEIMKQLISQYARVISMVTKETIKDLETITPIQTRIEVLTNTIFEIENDKNAEQINVIRKIMADTFKYTNNVEKNELFAPITKKLNNQIKMRLISNLKNELNGLYKFSEKMALKDYNAHVKKKIVRFHGTKDKPRYSIYINKR